MEHSTAKMIRDLTGFPSFAKVGRCLHAFTHVLSFVFSTVAPSTRTPQPGNKRGSSSPHGTVSTFLDEANSPTCLTRDSSLQKLSQAARNQFLLLSLRTGETSNSKGQRDLSSKVVHVSCLRVRTRPTTVLQGCHRKSVRRTPKLNYKKISLNHGRH